MKPETIRLTFMRAHCPDSFLAVLISGILVVAMIGCSDSPTDGNNEIPEDDTVVMGDHTFNPSVISISVGETVTWVNESNLVHTVTSGASGNHDGNFDSGSVPPGGEFSHTFQTAGSYEYFCIPHLSAGMTGTVHVQDNDDI